LQKRKEADIVKAANLSDIHFIDPAKDGGGLIRGPRLCSQALFFCILIRLICFFAIFFINNAIQNTEDISKLYANSN
jgi:hypothetical protein